MKGLLILPYTSIEKEKILNLVEKFDLIIGVDGGCNILYEYNIIPDLIIGDFDTINTDILEYYKNKNIDILKLEVEKDLTDGEASILEGLKRGCTELLLCAPSFFLETDHLLGNIFLLSKYNNCSIINENELIRLIEPSKIFFNKKIGTKISLVPLEKSELIISGMKYNGHFKVKMGDSLTLRNEIIEEKSEITLLSGKMLVIQGLKVNSMI